MIGVLVFLVVTVVTAAILTTLWVAMWPIKKRDDLKSWKVLAFMLLFCAGFPYAYVEFNTKRMGGQMEPAIKEVYSVSTIEGPLVYYKVLYQFKDKAKVLIVGEEKEAWGGTDHPMVTANLKKINGKWHPVNYKIVASGRMNKDDFVYPAYW